MKWERNKNENLTFSINLIGQVMEFTEYYEQKVLKGWKLYIAVNIILLQKYLQRVSVRIELSEAKMYLKIIFATPETWYFDPKAEMET